MTHLREKQKEEARRIETMAYKEYYQWLMGLRGNLSDYLTQPMNEAGWVAREVIGWDDFLLNKLIVGGEIPGPRFLLELEILARHLATRSLAEVARGRWQAGYSTNRRHRLLQKYIESFRPDVIFIREPCHIDSRIFDVYRERALLVGMIACQTNHAYHWNEHRHDLIFTFTEEYKRFFEVQGIPARVLQLGVDRRIRKEVGELPKKHDVTFVGYLGTPHQSQKTKTMAAVASKYQFHWWGPKGPEIRKFPELEKTWQGEVAGLEMLKIYKQSKIVVNDYPDFMQGTSNNMRNMEVFSVGSLLLTRFAENISDMEQNGCLVAYRDIPDCLEKIGCLLQDDKMRERIAKKGMEAAQSQFDYRSIVGKMMEDIQAAHEKKRAKLKTW